MSRNQINFEVRLDPGAEEAFHLTTVCQIGDESPPVSSYDAARSRAAGAADRFLCHGGRLSTGNEQFDDWVARSGVDLHMMTTDTAEGPYLYAGVPWFSTPFGRDGILTALETLWLDPCPARGVLAFLAAHQARTHEPARDAEPGKILHEMRRGEMAALGEVPFGRYHGSVDSTPLFVVLAGAYWRRTGDRGFVERLWPHVEAALRWIDGDGDPDRDGLVEYSGRADGGLVQQGWKDSHDSVFHADGRLADGPIALCEVQGYVFAAKRAAAELAALLGRHAQSAELERQAEALRERFEETFWCEDIGTYALALDGRKEPCRVRSSNPGHCLAAGIVRPDRAARVASALMAPDGFSGWGVRTIDARELRYNPMSYHNGSVWPHDNAIIAAGMDRYRFKDHTLRLLEGLYEACRFFDLNRMPELFCGFPRRSGQGPTLYPVACSPQAWSAAAVYLLLGSCLGVQVDAVRRQVRFDRPVLPEFLPQVRIRNLHVTADSMLDLVLLRHGRDVGVNVIRREGDIEVVAIK